MVIISSFKVAYVESKKVHKLKIIRKGRKNKAINIQPGFMKHKVERQTDPVVPINFVNKL